jgi:hypothetical protein
MYKKVLSLLMAFIPFYTEKGMILFWFSGLIWHRIGQVVALVNTAVNLRVP